MTLLKTVGGASLALALATGLGTAAQADDLAEFYKDKRIQVIIGSGPGGGYDTYARMMARHMGQYIPGNPDFIAKNMDGAGSIIATNFVYNVAPQDGTVIGAIQRNAPIVQIMGQKGPKFEAVKVNWLGSFNNEVGIIAVAERSGITKFEDLFEKQVPFGATGPNDTEFYPALVNNTIGTKIKLIKGYPSTPPAHLAMERGEIDGISQSWASFQKQSQLYKDGKMVLLAQVSLTPLPELKAKGVPMLSDFIDKGTLQGDYTRDEVESIFRLLMATKTMGRPYMLGPDVPKDRVEALRTAFNKTAEDKGFLAEADKQGRDVTLVTGKEIQDIVEKMASAPKEVLAKVEDATKFQGIIEEVKIELARHKGPVTKTERGGRKIFIKHDGKEVSAKVSGSRTKVTLDGKDAKRGAIKEGMTCEFVYPNAGAEAKEVNCTAGQS